MPPTVLPDVDINELIRKYRQYDCVWNFNNPNYKCKMLRQKAWLKIANYFQKDVYEVKHKIKHLRSAYVTERRKVIASKKSKSKTTYKPSLSYYNQLTFLDDVVVLRKFENVNNLKNAEDHKKFLHTQNSCKFETFVGHKLEAPLSQKTKSTQVIASARSLPIRTVAEKISGEVDSNDYENTNPSSLADERNEATKNMYFSFGNTVALQLQQLPLKMAMLATSEIQAILTKKILENIKSSSKIKCSPKYQPSWSHSESEDSGLIVEFFNGLS